ncbi:ycf3-interacting protein 1, chloroplastic isoform X2 [Durio zibethinus]|uniref:Ycf3-interacting protein 1, chloroplastic isoform X2 n=1 Tax=Durio zibethinus TaxID=66656 RepID=A0A6P6ACF5_DURZI|nr:ycf3-interacting protein 1, chloroplastic isoform X2 [Durio zibethinus]
MGTLQASQVAFASTCSSSSPPAPKTLSTCKSLAVNLKLNKVRSLMSLQRRKSSGGVVVVVGVGKEDTQQVGIDEDDASSPTIQQEENEDLQWVRQIQRVLELLRKNRDMLFSEVKLTVMIEDPREVERRRLLGIEDPDSPTRDDLVDALEQVNEGKIPTNRVALRMLAEEMSNWPNLEVEAPKKKRRKSLYAKATDTGIDPKEAAKRLNIDWDSAAEIEDADISDETEVPPAVGYGALYLVTAFPVIIGISVVLILFYNSLQ